MTSIFGYAAVNVERSVKFEAGGLLAELSQAAAAKNVKNQDIGKAINMNFTMMLL